MMFKVAIVHLVLAVVRTNPARVHPSSILPAEAFEDVNARSDTVKLNPTVSHERPPADLSQYGYELDVKLGSGGQSFFWRATEVSSGRQVAIQFPFAMCENVVCRVAEIDTQTLEELRSSCDLASAANGYYERYNASHESYFTMCLVSVSVEASHLAFQVWELVEGDNMDEAFFFGSAMLGTLNLGAKRRIIAQLGEAIALLSQGAQQRTCCCSMEFMNDCSTFFEWSTLDYMFFRTCPSGYLPRPGRCGAIVHHDIKFDNVVLKLVAGTDGETHVHPKLIDFGAAAWCHDGKSNAYSEDWAPFWLADARRFPSRECWSYDIYGLGVAWLTTELLEEVDPDQLRCYMFARDNPAGRSDAPSTIDNVSHASFNIHPCDAPDEFSSFRQSATSVLGRFVHELHRQLLARHALIADEPFRQALDTFQLPQPFHLP
eukprot:TRINITY_DN66291_c0_g1_i1.p1 TRINITY_DN66291_c0_g1~~TRINITY_DN66291_c0_g1_i1.p1  ORF type:complete len:432 (-),score=18.03 TRINITY_DN66291_c0_g1_i1:28-1323(-)